MIGWGMVVAVSILFITQTHRQLLYLPTHTNPKAHSYYEIALEIEQKTLPPHHHSLGRSYANIGILHENMNEYSNALSVLERALNILLRSGSSNNPELVVAYRKSIERVRKKM